jgi:hypothetical protein
MSASALHPTLGNPSPSPPEIYRFRPHSTWGAKNPQGAKPPPPGCYGSRSRRSGRVPAEPYPPLRDLDGTMPVPVPNSCSMVGAVGRRRTEVKS